MLLLGASNSGTIRRQRRYMPNKLTFLVALVLLVALKSYLVSAWNPYEILGVRKDASPEQIKRAYRDLAKRYHPDKSTADENDSGKKFIEINKAFDILKDPLKRTRYDQHGTVDESRHSRGYHQGANMYQHHHAKRARDNWSAHNGYRTFTFYTSSGSVPDSYFRKKSISTRQYLNEYVKKSKHQPFLIFFFTDFCPSCLMIESSWIKITSELAKFNVGEIAINVHAEPRLSRELGVSSIPHIACLLDGRIHHYHQDDISLTSIVKFIKNLLPSNLVPLLGDAKAQDRHISQLLDQSNRLSAIIINDEKNLKLRYLLLVYSLRQYYRFGHVSTKLSEYKTLSEQYNISIGRKSHILVFDEQINRPRFHIQYQTDKVSMSSLTRNLLAWPFLKLPRLWSQQIFDDLCLYAIPKEDDRVTPKLCVILFAKPTPSSLPSRKKMLEFIELNHLGQDKRIIFAFMDPVKQKDFVEAIIYETALIDRQKIVQQDAEFYVILIQRLPENRFKAHYTWLQNRWDISQPNDLDKAKLELYQYIRGYRQGMFMPEHKILLKTLIDEEGPSLLQRIYGRLSHGASRVFLYITSKESFATVVILIGCALLTSLFLYKSPVPNQYQGQESDYQYYRPREEEVYDYNKSSRTTNGANLVNTPSSEMNIMELKAETYNGMLRLLKPGYRSIILLTDQESKEKLIKNFKKSVWPYRKNRTLSFGFLCLDKNLTWYKRLLEQVLGCEELNVNKKNCIGTVLSLNGFKKYFRVYHAKHHEIDSYDDETDNDGSFLGFNQDDQRQSEDPELALGTNNTSKSIVYTVDNLLDKLPIWLDKMFDGLTKRYFVEEWPEEIK